MAQRDIALHHIARKAPEVRSTLFEFLAGALDGLPEVGGLFDLAHQRRDGRNGRGQRTDIVGNAARRLAQNLLIQRFQDINVAHLFFIAEPAVVDIRKAAGQGIDRMRSDQHRRRGRQTGTAARNAPRCRCRNNCTNTGSHSPCRLDDLPRNALVLIVIDDCRDRTLGPVHSICHTGGDFLLASIDFFLDLVPPRSLGIASRFLAAETAAAAAGGRFALFDPAATEAAAITATGAGTATRSRIPIQPIGQRIIDGLEALGALGGGGRTPLERFEDAGAAFLGGADLAHEVVGEVLAPRIVRPVQHAVQVGEQALVLRPERVQLRRLSPQLSGRDLNLFHSLSSLHSVTGPCR